MWVAGIDVWKRRWVAVVLRDGRYERAIVAPRIDDLLSELSDMAAIGIDMPIGLTSGTERREADTEARKFVGLRRSSVFPTYPREIYAALDYNTAQERCLALTGGSRSISRQAYALSERVLELEEAVVLRDDIREVHPEVSFCAMAGRHLGWTKTSWNGLHERVRLLRDQQLVIPAEVTDIGDAGAEDLLDAAAAAWSATRIASGNALSLPNPPQVANGRQIAIWY
ncbi:MAG: DUF429 domain-containing protein [Solirubrobacteraceae bacterium]